MCNFFLRLFYKAIVRMGRRKSVLKAGNFMIPVSSVANPPPPAPASASSSQSIEVDQEGGMDPLSETILSLNANPYIIAVFMLVLNLGGRFLSLELTKKQEEFLQQPWLRPILFFTVVFIATRNLAVAFWVALFFFFIVWVVANENSQFCMIPSWCGHNSAGEKEKYEKNIQKIRGLTPP